MTQQGNKHFVVIRVARPADEADFFSRVFNAPAMVAGETTRLVDTGRFVVRIELAATPAEATRGMHFEISVDNVNRFAEEVWNRGVKYASRPLNDRDGMRRVGFVSPGDIRIVGVGPLKLDSTGAFPAFKDGKPI
ncbi:MAG: hypothetical protein HS108_12265 [Planctomycetes bacterium]|jgi:hypothetical protein|nr:hypothetical protein [Planctomycetota bacterium]MCL4729618.1 hypothetical protein [Planctomycetota bacterium]